MAVDALQRGEGVRVDVAELAFAGGPPITVLNTASVGLYPDFVTERERREPRSGKWLAAVVAAARVLHRSDPVDVVVGARRARVWSLYVGVGPNDPGIPAPMRRRRLDGGVLDVRVLHAGSRLRAAGTLAFGRRTSALLRGMRLLPKRFESYTTESIDVLVRPRHGQPPGFAHDGEVATEATVDASARTPAPGYRTTVRIVPAALDVYRPRPGS